MLNSKINDAINAQINAEMWSAYLYLSMSMDAQSKGLKGIANWFAVQFREEQAHAQIFMNYINARGGKVVLAPIAEVKTEWTSPLDMFKHTKEHEEKVTALIDNLYSLAADEKDFATMNMLKWFVDEQVEEEANVAEMIDAFDKVEGNKFGLYMLDKELATRQYTVPSPLAKQE